MPGDEPYFVFRSIHHPGGRSKAIVFGARYVKPLGTCMIPVMIGALVTMLEGFPVLHYLYWGFPAASTVAFLWTWLRLRDEVVELRLAGDAAAALSLFDAAEPAERADWFRILDYSVDEDLLRITLGHAEVRLNRRAWQDVHLIQDHLAALMEETRS